MNTRKILLLCVGLIVVVVYFQFDLGRFFTLDSLKANRENLLALHAKHPIAVALAFMAIYIIQTVLALPGAALLSLSAGMMFGPLCGTLYAVTAASIGATISFLLTRYLLRDYVLTRFGGKLERINHEMEERGIHYLLFARLVPLFPFFLINLASGLTRLPLRTFILGTFIGIIPGGFVYVNAGASLASITALSDVASPRVLGAFALVGLFALIPALYAKLKS